jgi:hypothetical protein
MTIQIKQLCDCLAALLDAFRELKRIVMQERESVVSLDITALDTRRIELELFFAHVRDVSEQASKLVIAACEAQGVTGEKGLSQLIDATTNHDRGQLVKLQKSIKEVSAAVENDLRVNRDLLKDSLDFTSKTLQVFTSILKSSSSNTYGQQGRFIETAGQPRIICKEV